MSKFMFVLLFAACLAGAGWIFYDLFVSPSAAPYTINSGDGFFHMFKAGIELCVGIVLASGAVVIAMGIDLDEGLEKTVNRVKKEMSDG